MSNEDRFKKMIEHSQDWFWEFDENAVFTYASPAIRRLLGYEPEEIVGKCAFDLMSPEEAARVHGHFDPIAEKYLPFTHLENINLHKDGHTVVIESSGTPVFDESGRFRGYRGVDRDITQRKQAEEELRQGKQKFQAIIDASSDWIWEIDQSGRHVFSNHRIFDLLGYQPEDLIDKAYSEYLHEDDLHVVQKTLPRLIAARKGWDSWVLRWRHKDGSYRYLESNARPIFNAAGEVVGYRGADRDITERKLQEDALLESREMLARTQQIARVGSWSYDPVADRLAWSDETHRIFGTDPAGFEPSYNAFLETVHPGDRAMVDEVFTRSLGAGHETYEVEHRIVRKDDGEIRYVLEKSRHERDPNGSVLRSVGMVQDITERKLNEVALVAATEAAEAANRAQATFLAQVSHEIRTPMTAIVGFGELLADTDLTREQQNYLDTLNASSRAMLSLIDDILDLSKAEVGKLKIKAESFCLSDIISRLENMLEQQIADKGLAFEVRIDEDVPGHLVGDSLRIQQVLLNLLSNAVKFTEQGGVSLTVSVADENAMRLLLDIAVKDTGIGIANDFQDQVFKPFAQAGNHAKNYGGTGLGLAISRSLVGLMGGTLGVESRLGEGSTFRLLLPLQKEDGRAPDAGLDEEQRATWRGPELNILLAEDNPINTRYITAVLENMGHRVTSVENGRSALEALTEAKFDLVLMDINMPVMSGVEALQALRHAAQYGGQNLKVVALTAYALIGDKEKYLKMGFNGYLSKPVKTSELVAELSRIISE